MLNGGGTVVEAAHAMPLCMQSSITFCLGMRSAALTRDVLFVVASRRAGFVLPSASISHDMGRRRARRPGLNSGGHSCWAQRPRAHV